MNSHHKFKVGDRVMFCFRGRALFRRVTWVSNLGKWVEVNGAGITLFLHAE